MRDRWCRAPTSSGESSPTVRSHGLLRSLLVAEPPPAFDDHIRLGTATEPFLVQQFLSRLAFEAFDEAVLPGASRRNESRADQQTSSASETERLPARQTTAASAADRLGQPGQHRQRDPDRLPNELCPISPAASSDC